MEDATDQELRDPDMVEGERNRILSWAVYNVSIRVDFESPA